jgi:DNA repair photolyase
MSIIYEPKGKALEYAPLAANLYSGCSHGCTYCYAPSALRRDRNIFHSDVSPRKNILELFQKDILSGKYKNKRALLSFTTDPYQPCESKLKITRRAICMMSDAGMNFEILTKGGMRASRDFDLYNDGDCFASTLTFDNDKDSKKWEPIAALPSDRIEAIKVAHKMGIETWASFEPVIDTTQSIKLIKKTHRFVDLFKVGKANYVKDLDIDWHRFANEVVELLESLNCKYYIKKDLAAYMDVKK